MAKRTLKFYGHGYAQTPVQIEATFDNQVVYTGTVPTLNEVAFNRLPEQQKVLFEVEVDQDFVGKKPVSVTVTGGTLLLAHTYGSSVMYQSNPVYSALDFAVAENREAARADRVEIWKKLANPPLTDAEAYDLLTKSYAEMHPILIAHGLELYTPTDEILWTGLADGDSKTNVYINGIPKVVPAGNSDTSWEIADGGTITFDLNIEM
jgi:hypothetical protein